MRFEAGNGCRLDNDQYPPKLPTFKILEISLINLTGRVGGADNMTPHCLMAKLAVVVR